MNQVIFYILICLCTSLGCYVYFRPKLKATQKLDEFTQKENDKLWKQRNRLEQEIEWQQTQIKVNQEAIEENEKTAKFWSEFLMKQQTEANNAADQFKKKAFALAEKDFEDYLKDIEQRKYDANKEFADEFFKAREDCISEYLLEITEKQDQLNSLQYEIDNERSKVDALIEESKRIYEQEHKRDYYRLCLSDDDIGEIYELRKIIPHLRNAEPLNKVIWKVYYEKPYTDLIGRVVGTGVHTGIYKITNIENQMCYVGQAANIADRWKTHIKRGLGAETPINNKLYPAMKEFGVENFTFEIIEECNRAILNEREDYWQEVFKAKEFGYSIK